MLGIEWWNDCLVLVTTTELKTVNQMMSKGLNDGYYDVGTKDEFERLLGNDSAVSCKRNKKDDTADAET